MDTSAMTQVFAIPELLELILLQLPRLDLLLSQRTSRLFHHLTSTSPLLQKALFMRPDWTLQGHYATDKPGARPLNNLMLRQIMGGMYPTMTLRMLSFASPAEFAAARATLSLSVSTKEAPAQAGEPWAPSVADPDTAPDKVLGFWAWNVNVSFPADALLDAQKRNPAIGYEHASWRRMYMSQPPATELHLCKRWRRAERPAVVVESGITMGDLVEAAQEDGQGKGQGGGWSEVFIASDRDWHLEGPIRYSHFEEKK